MLLTVTQLVDSTVRFKSQRSNLKDHMPGNSTILILQMKEDSEGTIRAMNPGGQMLR